MKTEDFPFIFEEFNITHEPIPESVATRIMLYHIIPVVKVRQVLGIAMWPSQNSCWRTYIWEIQHNRSGDSQHTFGQNEWGDFDEAHKGACDWTCTGYYKPVIKENLLEQLIKHTEYNRFAIYPGFIHCDYKKTPSGKREVYNSRWELKFKIG